MRSRLITNGVYTRVTHLHIAVPTITCSLPQIKNNNNHCQTLSPSFRLYPKLTKHCLNSPGSRREFSSWKKKIHLYIFVVCCCCCCFLQFVYHKYTHKKQSIQQYPHWQNLGSSIALQNPHPFKYFMCVVFSFSFDSIAERKVPSPPLYAIFTEYITNPSRKHACVLPIPEFSAIRAPIMILCGLLPKFGSVVWNLAVWRDCLQEALFTPPTSPGGGDHII